VEGWEEGEEEVGFHYCWWFGRQVVWYFAR
jgi:hypothetical protein